ncbi:FAR1-related sequence 5 [Euphorbia peplus]|nr:FAR1-related sequence 5 [Euphorbia peplus]
MDNPGSAIQNQPSECQWGFDSDKNKKKKKRNSFSHSSSFSATTLTLETEKDVFNWFFDQLDDSMMISPTVSNSQPSEDNRNEMPAESSSGAKEKTKEANFLVPAVGLEFSSEEEVYEFYKTYAEETGFHVRKGKVQRLSDRLIRKRYFFCSREGRKQHRETTYKRKETRTGCTARIVCQLEDGKWKISQFCEDHNHHLQLAKMAKVDLRMEVFSDEKTNVLHREEAQSLIDYCSYLQEEDPSFLSAVQLDADGRVKNFFWTDQSSAIDYKYFGDVLVLDTTYKIDKYEIICAPLFGLNHNRQYILFGCAFLLDETIDSYIWLLQTFVKAMGSGGQPQTILTNESLTMADAIKAVFPEAKHQFGLWHIRRNVVNLSKYYRKAGFERLFNRWFFECQTEEEFNSRWFLLQELFDIHNDPWLKILYVSREKWTPMFNKKTFIAGIQDTASFDGLFRSLTRDAKFLRDVVADYLKLLVQQRNEVSYNSFLCKEKEQEIFLNNNSAEQQASRIYTRSMFKIFQKELVKCLLLEIEEMVASKTTAKFKLIEEDGNQSIVEFDSLDSSAACSCRKYESVGILCRHVLKVFRERNVFLIPHKYILKRWTKFVKED